MAGLVQRLLELLRDKSNKKRVATSNRRALRMECLESRRTMDAEISGIVYQDLTDNGVVDTADPRLAGVTVSLFRDGGNGVFGGDDTSAGTPIVTTSTGRYAFPVTTTGLYFVQQTTPSGTLVQRASQRVQSINITSVTDSIVLNVDDFDSPTTVFQADSSGTNPNFNTTPSLSNVLGSVRDLHATATAGVLTVNVDGGNSNAIDLQPSQTGAGTFLITYDGDDTNAANAIGTGLGTGTNNFDLTQGGTASGFTFVIGTEDVGSTIRVRISGVGGTSTSAAIPIPVTTNGASATLTIPYDSILGTADITQIGGIQFEITQNPGQDTQIGILGLFRTNVVNIANLAPMTIGNLVFLDRNNDGLFAGADTGIGGVTVQLFNDLGTVGTFEPGTDTAVTVGTATATTSTTVGSEGQYTFTGLLPGNYFVVIPSSQFGAGQPLLNHISSPGATVGDTDNADHGAAFVTGVGVTGAVVLTTGGEPTSEDGDANTNLTMDFGFVSAVLGLTKTDSPDPVRTGQNLTYTLTATNNGPSNSTNTVITDPLPTGLTLVSARYSINGGAPLDALNTAGTISTPPFTLPNGQSTVLTIIATVGATFVTGTQNTGSVDNDEGLPVAANATTGLVPNIDLSIDKSIVGGATTVGIGGTLTYRLNLTNNNATTTVTGIRVTDSLPPGFTAGALPAGVVAGVVANEDLVWTIPTLAPQASISVDIPVNVTTTATIGSAGNDNVATIDVAGLVGFRDSDPSNDSDTVNVTVQPRYNLLVTKNDSLTSVTTGQNITYTIEVNNSGPSAATNVQVTDTLPAGLLFVSATSGGANLGTINGQAYSATIPSLASGATTTILLVAQVRPGATGATIENRVDVSADSPANETAGRPNTATDTNTLNRVVTLNVDKVDTVDPVIAGGANFTYVVTAFNSGSADAPNVLFSDPLPTGLRFVEGSFTINETVARTGQVTFNNTTNRLEANLGTLLAGGSSTVNRALITLTVQALDTAAAGTITNTATLTSPDNVPGVTDSENTVINRTFDLTVTKTDNADTISAGGTLIYTIIISNTGVSAASNVTLTDPIPANTTFSSVTSSSGTFTNVNGSITGTLPTLVQGAPVTVTVTVTVNNNAPEGSVISNTAVVSAAGETNVLTNSATAIATVASTASLRGFVYVDANRDNVRGAGENGIRDVLITISGTINGQNVRRTTTTDANGEYFFTGLAPGNYTVTQTQPANYIDAATNPGSAGGTAATNQIANVTLAGGVNSLANNFGEIREFSKRQFLASTIDN